jgi:hypothetical protein
MRQYDRTADDLVGLRLIDASRIAMSTVWSNFVPA